MFSNKGNVNKNFAEKMLKWGWVRNIFWLFRLLTEKVLFHHKNFVHFLLLMTVFFLTIRAVSKLHPALTFQNSTECAKYMLPRGGPEKCVRCLCVAGLKCQAQINQSANFSHCLSLCLSAFLPRCLLVFRKRKHQCRALIMETCFTKIIQGVI